MKNKNWKSLLPIAVGIVLFIITAIVYVSPVLKGKALRQSDMIQNVGGAKEVIQHREKYNEEPLWTNSMFGGMPAYQINTKYPGNLIYPIRNALFLFLPYPASAIFIYFLGFFILLLTLKINKWLSIVGALGFGLSAFFFIIIEAGHVTQALAIGFMAPVFAGVILICREKYLLGGAVLAFFFTMELMTNHPQITYYLSLMLLIYVIFEFIERFKNKQIPALLKMTGVFIVAGVLAIGVNFNNLSNTFNYAKLTIRGPSELTHEQHNKTGGLDRDYVTQWSMGKSETLTLLIPGFKGRSSGMSISENKNALKNVDPNMREVIGSLPQYWGDQPGTSSPYSGAIIVFLFVLGLFIIPGRLKWTLLITTLLSILLSWGKNLMWFTDLFLDYFPLYNKFRAVSMTLVLAEVAIPILAVLALDKLIRTPDIFKQNIRLAFSKKEISIQKAFYISFALTGGLSFLFYLMPQALTNFTWIRDDEVFQNFNSEDVARQVMSNIEIARIALFKSEAIRSFLFITAGALTVWLLATKKITSNLFIPVIGLLFLIDLIPIDKAFLNDKNFVTKQETKNPFPETIADKAILQDKDLSYRVFDLTDPNNGPFNSARASFFHKSIGGYHAAKLRKYQELIEHQISKNMQNINTTFRANPTEYGLDSMLAKQGVLNMLNMRYLIYSTEAPPIVNKHALGNAWFIKNIQYAATPDEEIKQVGEINPATTVVMNKKYEEEFTGYAPNYDSLATIKLIAYKANDLKYETNAATEQLAVFSEIYFKDGWNAYIDGNKEPYICADWILRAMKIPAGKHTVEFKFEPQLYYIADKISFASSITLVLALLASVFFAWKNKGKNGTCKEQE